VAVGVENCICTKICDRGRGVNVDPDIVCNAKSETYEMNVANEVTFLGVQNADYVPTL
jgi:hypothetical protein